LIYSAIVLVVGSINTIIGFWEYQMNKTDFIRSSAAGLDVSYAEGLLFQSSQMHSSLQFSAGVLIQVIGLALLYFGKQRLGKASGN
jgi:hypothetical protein